MNYLIKTSLILVFITLLIILGSTNIKNRISNYYDINYTSLYTKELTQNALSNNKGSNNSLGLRKYSSYEIGVPDKDYIYNYYVKFFDNHLCAFNSDGSLYLYTSIVSPGIEIKKRKLIDQGIYFKDYKDLYTFLESCST